MKDLRHADLLDMSVLQSEVHRRAADAGLSVEFVDALPTPLFDWRTKTIKVPRITPPATQEDVEYLRGSIIHEIGHSNRTESVKRAEQAKLDMSKPFGRILNVVEDAALEREIAGQWYGDAISLGESHDIHVRRQLDMVEKLKAEGKLEITEENTKTNAVYLVSERYRNWDRWSAGSRERLKTEMPAECVELADKLDKAGWGERIGRARTTDEVYTLAKELYKQLFDDDKDPETDASSTQNAQGQGDGKGEAEGGKAGKGKASGKPGEEGKSSVTPWTLLTSDHTFDGKPDPSAKVDYTGHSYRRPTGTAGLLLPVSTHRPSPEKSCPTPKVPPFVGQLRILLQSEAKNKFEFGLTSGKLDQRKLAKLALPVVPGSDSWRKVFKKRIPGRKINTAVQILVDGSGSMSGHKNVIASDAADLLCQAFTGPLRIKTAVHAFDAGSRTNRIWPIKEFTENVQPGTIASRSRGVGFGGNADGDAVIWALDRMV